MSEPIVSNDVLSVKIEKLEKEVSELRYEQKEDRKVLLENVVRQTTLMEKMEQRAEKQDLRLDKIDEKLDQVNIDVQAIKTRSEMMQNNNSEEAIIEDKKWYQTFITDNQKKIWIILALLLASILGFNAKDILSFFM